MSNTAAQPVRRNTFQAANSEVFASLASVDWFIRQHRAELLKAGAIVRPLRELMIVPEPFSRVVVEVGVRKAGAA